ncbi:MAG: FecR domain-containing protein [Spirochaetes bacterium]|nr:FecR domain-containing protein [Spirochaetota bacterium]
MKRIAFLCLVGLVMLGVSCKKESRTEVAREGAVNFVTGEVFIITDGSKVKAKVGDAVKKGSSIETGAKSMVDVYFGNNVIKVLEKSLVRIDKLTTVLATNTERSEIYVEHGRLFSKVVRKLAKGETYRIKTPTTIAAVRGTEFLVAQEEKKSTVACLDGQVAVLNKSLMGEAGTVETQEAEAPAEEKFNLEEGLDALNKSLEGKGAVVVIDGGEEVAVEQNRPMTVQELSESNRKMMQDILSNIRELQADIRRKFEEERDRIVKAVEEQKQRNEEMMREQIQKDQQNVKDQIDTDKENVRKVLGDTDVKGVAGSTEGQRGQAEDAVKAQQNQQKDLFKDILPKTEGQ